MARIDVLQERMLQTMPLPVVENIVRIAKARLMAAAFAQAPIQAIPEVPGHEQQMSRAMGQLVLGAYLQRIDSNPTDWTEANSATWRFKAQADTVTGAESRWLDVWGRILQVPRYTAEPDTAYRLRIADEVIAPCTTNMGLAAIIDRYLGEHGTIVLEGEGFFGNIRLNDGHRMNAGGRLMGLGAFGAESLNNTFVVITPSPVTVDQETDIKDICDRKRAAGNRLLAITNDGRVPHIFAPTYAAEGSPFTARVLYPEGGVTYTWSVTGGTINSGQGTSSIQITGTAIGDMAVTVTQTGGIGDGKASTKTITIVQAPNVGIAIDATEAQAGEPGHTAIVTPQLGATYTWTITNGFLTSGQGTNSIQFGMGEADEDLGRTTSIECVITDIATGVGSTGTGSVNVLPYPYASAFTTGVLMPNAAELGSVPWGNRIELKEIATSGAARVRFYETAAQASADLSRPIGTNPIGNHGQINETITPDASTGLLDIVLDPTAAGTNGDAPQTGKIYYSVVNLGSGSTAITVTGHYIKRR